MGKKNGSIWRFKVLHWPVFISLLIVLSVKVVVRRYFELLLQILVNALKISSNERCTRQSRVNIKSTFGRVSFSKSNFLKYKLLLLYSSLFAP